MSFVIPLEHAAVLLGKHGCGAKAFELSRLMGRGYAVPDGVVVTDEAYRRVMAYRDANGIDPHRNDGESWGMPDEVRVAIVGSFEKLVTRYGAVSVRSSCTAEDLAEASFAGQYETVLNVRDRDQLFRALTRCWRAQRDPRVQAYAQERRVSLCESRMPLLIQGMVHAEKSGVSFSIHPVTNEDTVVINVSYGLGEAIVSGLVTPDTFLFDKSSGASRAELGLKEVRSVLTEDGVREVETSVAEQNRLCVSPAEAAEIFRLTQCLEREYGVPVDVEFSIANGQLFILQVRPISTTNGRVAM
ncbi:MAG: PEP/pyruvate-binding domain-containing protein [Alicyclobacillus sp.]|nr:PEP/pyruvate-binding domain-containing protein [Alicyclobacillus sp.]